MAITRTTTKCPVCNSALMPIFGGPHLQYTCGLHTWESDDPKLQVPVVTPGNVLRPDNTNATGGGQKANASEVKIILGMMSAAGILDDLMQGPAHQQAYMVNGWLDQQEINFLMDMRDKAARAGMGLFVSPKQLNFLRDVKDKLVALGRI